MAAVPPPLQLLAHGDVQPALERQDKRENMLDEWCVNTIARGDHQLALVHLRVQDFVDAGRRGVNPFEAAGVLDRLPRDLPTNHDLGRRDVRRVLGLPGGEGDAHAGVDGPDLREMAFVQVGEDEDGDVAVRHDRTVCRGSGVGRRRRQPASADP